MKEKLVLKITVAESDFVSYADPAYPVNVMNNHIHFISIGEEYNEECYEIYDHKYKIEIVKIIEESLCKY